MQKIKDRVIPNGNVSDVNNEIKIIIMIEKIKNNIKPEFILNPNEKIVNGIIKGLIRNEGKCPCVNDSEDLNCPCTNYREKDKCCCNLYIKREKNEKDTLKKKSQSMAYSLIGKNGRLIIF